MEEMKYSRCDSYCCRCIGSKQAGKTLRTLAIVSNILYWFAGCAILSVAIWLRFVDIGTKNYFSTFYPVDTALYVILVASILFVAVSFVGVCAAYTNNDLMISLYIAVVLVVSIAEVVSLTIYSSSRVEIEKDFTVWYKGHFERYQSIEVIHREVVNHVQSRLECCGMSGPRDYPVVFGNESIPNSCIIQIKLAENIFRPDVYKTGCMKKLNDLMLWLLKGWPLPFVASIILLLQVVGITTGALFLQHRMCRNNFNYDEDENESSELINSASNAKCSSSQQTRQMKNISEGDLPRPKLFRVVKSSVDESCGFDVGYSEDRNCYVITDIQSNSNAEYAGLKVRSQVIEINGMILQGAGHDEVYEKIKSISNELRLVLVDEKTETVYRANKVAFNLKNLEGVTNDKFEYKPRLCNLKKVSKGFGFHLLYLEDRKGEYIEEVAPESPAHEAGLCVGDKIIDVNGVNVESEKSSDVIKRIRMTGDAISLLVVDPKTDGFYRKKGVSLSTSLTRDYFIGRTSTTVVSSQTDNRKTSKDVKPRYCRLVKSEKEDFGLYVVIDNNRIGQVIRWIDCGGPADRAGLRIGDRIIEVNGHSVEYESHQRLLSFISLSKTISHFIVVDEDYDRVYKRNKPRLCRIFKKDGSFGFCVHHVSRNDGHYIEEVESDGPAERAGLRVDDRIIQIDEQNIEKSTYQSVINRLRACKSHAVLLVIDPRANKHYNRIVQFKSEGMRDVDYSATYIPAEPLFLREEDDDESSDSDQISINVNSVKDTQSKFSAANTLRGNSTTGMSGQGHKTCTVRMTQQENHGFWVIVDRDRNGVVVKNLKRGGAGDRAGLQEGDRIISVNGDKINNLSTDEVLDRIQQSRIFSLTVVGEESDDVGTKNRRYLFRITKDVGGYGFYIWHDDHGHFVDEVTIGSPADQSGMRCGDRIIEVNGVNVEKEAHEEVFYRVKASINVVTLLAVDQKTFRLYKKNNIPLSNMKVETNFSAEIASSEKSNKTDKTTKTVTREVKLYRELGEDFGFNLAYSNSFTDESTTGCHIVYWVEAGGPAYTAGLRDGDKIVAVERIDVSNEDQDQVLARIHEAGNRELVLTIEFEEDQDAFVPHIVTIRKTDDGFGFHLWFDQNGHYIEDVTVGSAADVAGLKIGDRVLKVDGSDVEESSHADVVTLIRESDHDVSMLILSAHSENIGDFSLPTICTLMKEKGTFGFTLSEDEKGFHFDYVEPYFPADKMGISVGDRLLEIKDKPVSEMSYSEVVSAMQRSGSTVTITVISSTKITSRGNKASEFRQYESNAKVFNELSKKDKIDHVVESKGFGFYEQSVAQTDAAENKKSRNKVPGIDNPAFDDEKYDNLLVSPLDELKTTKVIKGRFLDEKLPHTSSNATTRRRNRNGRLFVDDRPTAEHRRRSLIDIEQKLNLEFTKTKPRSDNERVTYAKALNKSNQTDREKHFHLATLKSSLRQKWDFVQTDSRRPAKIKNDFVEANVIKEVDETGEGAPTSNTDSDEKGKK